MADELLNDEAPAPGPAAPVGKVAPPAPGKAAPVDPPDEYDEGQDDAGAEDDDDGPVDLLGGDDDEDGGEAPKAVGKPDASLSVVPKDAAGYAIPEIDGLKLTDADKPALQGFIEHAAKVGGNQATIVAGLAYYKDLLAGQAKLDATTSKAARDELVAELGADGFKTERGRVKNMLKRMPEGLGDDLQSARLPDGRKLINDPRFWRWAQGQNAMSRVPSSADRLKEIEGIMKTDMQRYWTEGLSEEYGRLIAEKGGSR
jgi:hypothetical protein